VSPNRCGTTVGVISCTDCANHHASDDGHNERFELASGNGSAVPSNGGGGKPLVFVSYSHKDEEWKNRLTVHLKALELDEQLALREDSRIDVGGKWRNDIVDALNRASVAILLVSRHFLASEFIIKQEVKHFLEQAKALGSANLTHTR
jgi:TIR domain